jgi:phosphatidate cytidylyltransferase
MLKQRIITALILAPILIFLVLYGHVFGFAVLIGIIQLAASYEWLKIIKLNTRLALSNALVLTVLTNYLIFVWPLPIEWIAMGYVFIWSLAVIWLLNHRWGYANTQLQLFVKGVLGVSAIVLFSLAINYVYVQVNGVWLTMSIFLLIWVADIGAYISGKTFGKHKLAINISPGKTWEGVIGATFFVAVFAYLSSSPLGMLWWQAILVMIPVAWFSVVGDLAASLGKRQAEIKDSSNLLPGHGGFIDRFDSLIAATPLYAYLLIYAL